VSRVTKMTIHRAGPVSRVTKMTIHRAGPVLINTKMTIHRAGPVYSLVLYVIDRNKSPLKISAKVAVGNWAYSGTLEKFLSTHIHTCIALSSLR